MSCFSDTLLERLEGDSLHIHLFSESSVGINYYYPYSYSIALVYLLYICLLLLCSLSLRNTPLLIFFQNLLLYTKTAQNQPTNQQNKIKQKNLNQHPYKVVLVGTCHMYTIPKYPQTATLVIVINILGVISLLIKDWLSRCKV